MRKFIVALAAAFVLGSTATLAQDAKPEPFAAEISEFRFRDEIRMPDPCGILFVGSSSIRLWVGLERDFAGLPIINRGFGGSQTSELNYYFDNLVAKYKPARIVLYEGENDINAGKSVDTVFSDIQTFMQKKDGALGSTPVYFLSVKPSPSRIAQFAKQKAVNAKVKDWAKTRDDLVYVDVASTMLNNSGVPRGDIFVSDRLHMNRSGYAMWQDIVGNALLSEPVSTAPQCKAVGG